MNLTMDYAAVATAVLVWSGAVLSPGPAFAAIVQSAVSDSRRNSVLLVLGITLGSAIYGVLTSFGLLWLIAQMGAVSELVRIAGAAYLIWLGIESWRSAGKSGVAATATAAPRWSGFGKGLLLELSNPKGIAFFVSVFAVSIPLDATVATKVTILGLGLVFELAWYLGATVLFSSGPVRRLYQCWSKAIARAFGALFIGFGVGLIAWRH